jgi:hypothetical protein
MLSSFVVGLAISDLPENSAIFACDVLLRYTCVVGSIIKQGTPIEPTARHGFTRTRKWGPFGVHFAPKRPNGRLLGGRLIFLPHVPQQLTENDPSGFRTRDLRIKSPLLYQLSYRVDKRRSSATM